MMVFEFDDNTLTDLPWYIVNPNKTFFKMWQTTILLMTWISVVLTPLRIVFSLLGSEELEQLLWLAWVTDISFSADIFVRFLVASPKLRTFSGIAKAYLTGYFLIDVVTTITPMVYLQKNQLINLLKLLRFAHIFEMFLPFKRLIDCIMDGKIARKRNEMHELMVLIFSTLLFGHMCTCAWIALGTREEGWITILQAESSGDLQFQIYGPWQIYVFASYWVYTVLTTVGYGDYSGYNSQEYVFTILLEFSGLILFSLLSV